MRECEARGGKPCLHNYTSGIAVNSCGLRKAATAETSLEPHVCPKTWWQTYRWIRGGKDEHKNIFLAGFAGIWGRRAGKSLNSHSRDLIS